MFATIENIHHRAHGRFAFVLRFPVFRFRNIFTQPQGKNDRQNADKEQRAPAPDGYDEAVDLRRDNRPHRETGDQKAAGFVAQMLGPTFDHVGGARAVFACHSHADHHAGNKHRDVARRKTARQRPTGKQHDTGDHRQFSPVAIAHSAKQQAAKPSGDKGGGYQAGRLDRCQPELRFNFR
ncbi:hypothetical protein D3C87_1532420 [compost metagenome]